MREPPLMTVIIPAYNEAHRLPQTLARVLTFVKARPEKLDVIVINNNSRDTTRQVADEFARGTDLLHVLDQPIQGKGAAVRKGILAATGEYAFICDADLAMPIEELPRFFPATLGKAYDIAIGSREVKGAQRFDEPAYRHLMGRVFNFVVRTLAVPGIQDTQCGFKLFKREPAQRIFGAQTIMGFSFDLEILYLANKWGYRTIEQPVNWIDAPGSKVDGMKEARRFLKDMWTIKRNDWKGVYDGK